MCNVKEMHGRDLVKVDMLKAYAKTKTQLPLTLIPHTPMSNRYSRWRPSKLRPPLTIIPCLQNNVLPSHSTAPRFKHLKIIMFQFSLNNIRSPTPKPPNAPFFDPQHD